MCAHRHTQQPATLLSAEDHCIRPKTLQDQAVCALAIQIGLRWSSTYIAIIYQEKLWTFKTALAISMPKPLDTPCKLLRTTWGSWLGRLRSFPFLTDMLTSWLSKLQNIPSVFSFHFIKNKFFFFHFIWSFGGEEGKEKDVTARAGGGWSLEFYLGPPPWLTGTQARSHHLPPRVYLNKKMNWKIPDQIQHRSMEQGWLRQHSNRWHRMPTPS